MILSAIVIAIALSIRMLLVARGCALQCEIRLTKGLAVSAVLALVHVALFYVAMLLGDILKFDDSLFGNVNELVFIGIILIVSVRWIFQVWRKDRALPAYGINRWGTVAGLALATGLNVFMVGLGFGFVSGSPRLYLSLPLFVTTLLSSYFGIMFGRRKVEMNIRRWQFLAIVMLLGVAISNLF